MRTDKPIRSPDTGTKIGATEPATNFVRRPLTTTPTTRPLSLAEQRARSRWQRPLAAILAEAMAVNRGLHERLSRKVRCPDNNHPELYQAAFNELWNATNKHIEVLEIFSRVGW